MLLLLDPTIGFKFGCPHQLTTPPPHDASLLLSLNERRNDASHQVC